MEEKVTTLYGREIDGFFKKIRERGYNDSDFTVRCLQWPVTAKPDTVASDLIIVKRTTSEIELAYAADTEGKWLASFLDDLHNGVFDLIERPRPLSVVKPDCEPEPQT